MSTYIVLARCKLRAAVAAQQCVADSTDSEAFKHRKDAAGGHDHNRFSESLPVAEHRLDTCNQMPRKI